MTKPISLLLLFLAGCPATFTWQGVDIRSNARVDAARDEMPTGHSFTGRYESTSMGKPLKLEDSGDGRVTGTYERLRAPDGDCKITGTLDGTTDGNLLRFAWTEDNSDCNDEAANGRGYALYVVPSGDNQRPRLYGHRGLNGEDRGQAAWQAVKTSTAAD